MIRIGADPELFLFDKAGDFVSGFNMIPGNKQNPFPVDNGAVQVDGMAVEFNIDPAANSSDFIRNINTVMEKLREMLPEGCEMKAKSCVSFSEEFMKLQPMESMELGCDPDFNAYNGFEQRQPDMYSTIRTAAGHVHIGWISDSGIKNTGGQISKSHFKHSMEVVKSLDVVLGVPSIILDKNGVRRREMYGGAGSFRPKLYGCEYRVLSNFWLNDDVLKKWVFTQSYNVANDFDRGGNSWSRQVHPDMVREIINSNNIAGATKLVKDYGITMP